MKFLKHLYYYYFSFIFAASFLALYPFSFHLLNDVALYRKAHRMRQIWARIFLFFAGARVEIFRRSPIDFSRTYIIVSNHASLIDIPVMLKIVPQYVGFLAKAELTRIPLLGKFFTTIDIEVDRESGEQSATAYRKAIRALRDNQSLVIFPEGGIYPDPLRIKPFKEGAFRLAVRNKVPILPISFPDNFKILPDGTKTAKPGKIRVILHDPVETGNLDEEDIPFICNKIYQIIQDDITEYAKT